MWRWPQWRIVLTKLILWRSPTTGRIDFPARCVIYFNWLTSTAALPTVHIRPGDFRVSVGRLSSIIKARNPRYQPRFFKAYSRSCH